MTNAKNVFQIGISQTRQMAVFYDHFINDLHIPHEQVSDILRSQFVYAVSAFDRFIHELIRKGIVEMISGTRIQTDKFLSHPFKAETLLKAIEYSASSFIPTTPQETSEYVINKEMEEKLSTLSFQAPDKVKDGLSFIWKEPHKMSLLANDMGIVGTNDNEKQHNLEQTLKLIVDRRNQIAHEGDIDPVSNTKRDLSKTDADTAINFISSLGLSIFKFITDQSCYINP